MALDLTSGKCVQIPIALSGSYNLDQNGSWEGTAAYEAGRARVKVKLNSFQHSQDEYAAFMMDVQSIVKGVAAKSPYNNVAVNLLYWSSYGYKYIDGENVHYIRFTGDLRNILDREFTNAAYADVSGDCDVGSTMLWDVNTGRMGMKMSFKEINGSENCLEAMDPVSLGYNAEINGDDFTVRFDARSLATAFAVNWDIMPVDLLSNVFDPLFDGKTIGCSAALNTPGCGNDTYVFFMGLDPDLPGMAPIYCLRPLTRGRPASSYYFTNLCAIRVVNQYVYPFFQHMGISSEEGNNPYEPAPCNCSTSSGKVPYCDDFDFVIGFVFFEVARDDIMLNWQYLLDMAYRNNMATLNDFIYHAAFAAQRTGGVALKYPPVPSEGVEPAAVNASLYKLQSRAWREETYSFCQQNCTVFSFRLFDDFNRFVNGDSYNLAHGGCSDTFYDNSYPYDVAALLPPAPLVQGYTECVNFLFTSVQTSFGVAMGTAAPITAAFVLLMCLTVGWVWEKFFTSKEVDVVVGQAVSEDQDPKNLEGGAGMSGIAGVAGVAGVAGMSPGKGSRAKATSRKAASSLGGGGRAGSSSESDGLTLGGFGSDADSDSDSNGGRAVLQLRRPAAQAVEARDPFMAGLQLINPVQFLFPAAAPPVEAEEDGAVQGRKPVSKKTGGKRPKAPPLSKV